MARICKNCGRKISLFEQPAIDGEGNVICKECSEKKKVEQEAVQKQKEELEYKAKLAKALSNNPQWEYKIVNLNLGDEDELTRMGLEGWNLVSAIAISGSAAKPAENPEGEKKEEEKPDEQKQPEPQPSLPEEEKQATPEGMICIFKRKL